MKLVALPVILLVQLLSVSPVQSAEFIFEWTGVVEEIDCDSGKPLPGNTNEPCDKVDGISLLDTVTTTMVYNPDAFVDDSNPSDQVGVYQAPDGLQMTSTFASGAEILTEIVSVSGGFNSVTGNSQWNWRDSSSAFFQAISAGGEEFGMPPDIFEEMHQLFLDNLPNFIPSSGNFFEIVTNDGRECDVQLNPQEFFITLQTPAPTGAPTSAPTSAPTGAPTSAPTRAPTLTPSAGPSTPAPTEEPSKLPTDQTDPAVPGRNCSAFANWIPCFIDWLGSLVVALFNLFN